MILRRESDGSLVMITQNDHAKAAGFCASHWGNTLFRRPEPYDSCVRAAFLHDLAWLREETSPRFDPRQEEPSITWMCRMNCRSTTSSGPAIG